MRPIAFIGPARPSRALPAALLLAGIVVVIAVASLRTPISALVGALALVAIVSVGLANRTHLRRTQRFARLDAAGIRASSGLALLWAEISHAAISAEGDPAAAALEVHEHSGRRHSWRLSELRVPAQHLIEEVNARAAAARAGLAE